MLVPKNKQKFHERLHNMYSLAEDYWGDYIQVDMMGMTCKGKKCTQNNGDQNL
jgi:hypothetical protein